LLGDHQRNRLFALIVARCAIVEVLKEGALPFFHVSLGEDMMALGK
jgi:hypothetical protein